MSDFHRQRMLPGFTAFLQSERAAEDYCNEVIDGEGRLQYLDSHGSVSASVEVEVDADYDPTHFELNRRLIHHGS